jgi:hypothetical protein
MIKVDWKWSMWPTFIWEILGRLCAIIKWVILRKTKWCHFSPCAEPSSRRAQKQNLQPTSLFSKPKPNVEPKPSQPNCLTQVTAQSASDCMPTHDQTIQPARWQIWIGFLVRVSHNLILYFCTFGLNWSLKWVVWGCVFYCNFVNNKCNFKSNHRIKIVRKLYFLT